MSLSSYARQALFACMPLSILAVNLKFDHNLAILQKHSAFLSKDGRTIADLEKNIDTIQTAVKQRADKSQPVAERLVDQVHAVCASPWADRSICTTPSIEAKYGAVRA